MHSLCQRGHTSDLANQHLHGLLAQRGVFGGTHKLQRNGHGPDRCTQVMVEPPCCLGLAGRVLAQQSELLVTRGPVGQ